MAEGPGMHVANYPFNLPMIKQGDKGIVSTLPQRWFVKVCLRDSKKRSPQTMCGNLIQE